MSDIYNITDTWNDSGTIFDAIKMNVADASSNVASNLLRLQVNGVDLFRVKKNSNLLFKSNGALGYDTDLTGSFLFTINGGYKFAIQDAGPNSSIYNFAAFAGGSIDGSFSRIGAGVIGVRGNTASVGASLNFKEQTAPAAPAADQVVLYAEDNGAGKTRLMARFPTGAAQQVAIEP